MRSSEPLIFRVGTSVTLNRVLRNQMLLLAGEGWRIRCIGDDDKWATELRQLGLEHQALGMGRRPNALTALLWGVRFWWLCVRERPTIVHTHNAFHGFFGRLAARLAGVPVVVQTVHNWYFLEPPDSSRARVFRTLERLAARCSDLVLFLNREDFDRAASEAIVQPQKRRLIGNGIDVGQLEDELASADRSAARALLGVGEEEAVLAMVARLEPPKDHETLLVALSTVVHEIPRLRVLLAGLGLRTDDVRRRIAELGMESQIDILGQRDDIAIVLRASDALVLSSAYEGVPRSLIEGMIAGLPMVGTDVVGIRDVIAHEETGILVPYRDHAAMADALVRVLRGGPEIADFARRGQIEARERFDERIPAQRVGQIYTEMVGPPGDPTSPSSTSR